MEQKNSTENIKKPISLEIAEFRKALISCINNCPLHPSLSGMILREVVSATLAEISAYEQKEINGYEKQSTETDNKK